MAMILPPVVVIIDAKLSFKKDETLRNVVPNCFVIVSNVLTAVLPNEEMETISESVIDNNPSIALLNVAFN